MLKSSSQTRFPLILISAAFFCSNAHVLAGGSGDPNGVIPPITEQLNNINAPSWVTDRNSQCVVSSDFFYYKTLNNNDGNYNWAGPWYEHNDDDNASTGKYYIDEGELVMYGRCCLGWDAGDINLMKYWSRDLNTEKADYIELTMSHKRWLMGISHFTIDVYSKGIWYDAIRDYTVEEGGFEQEKIVIPTAYASSDMKIRVRNSEFSSDGDIYYWDFVSVAQCFRPLSNYRISHSGNAVTCEQAPVTITSLDNGGNNHKDTAGHKIRITARSTDGQVNSGSWSIISGNGSINNTENGATANDGVAYYTYGANDAVVQLGLSHSAAGTVNIDIESINPGGAIAEISTGDTDLSFSDVGLKISNISSQISGKRSDLSPNSQQVQVRVVQSAGPAVGACQSKVAAGDELDMTLAVRCVDPGSCAQSRDILTVRSSTGTSSSHHALGEVPATARLRFEESGGDIYANLDLNYAHAGLIGLDLAATIAAVGAEPAINISGSSNDFLVKPWQIYLHGIQTPAGLANPAKGPGSNLAADQFLKAGEAFELQLSAVAWQQIDDTNNDGIADVGANLADNPISLNFNQSLDLSAINAQPANNTGGLNQASVALNNGRASVGNLRYSEVGSVQIQASTTNYQGQSVSGVSERVGRFDVAYLDLSGSASISTVDGCNVTYFGQPNLALTINGLVARNSAGSLVQNVDTANGFAAPDITLHLENANAGVDMGGRVANLQSGFWQNGVFKSTHSLAATDYHSLFNVARLADGSVDGPYRDLAISFSMPGLQSTDTLPSSSQDCDNADALKPDCTTKLIASNVDLYYGVLSAPSVLGNKLDDLPLSLRISYVDSSDPRQLLQRMEADSCSRFDQNADSVLVGPPSLAGADANKTSIIRQPANNARFVKGETPANNTYVLAAPNDNNEADIVVTFPTQDWLKFDWDNNPATAPTSPSGEANFRTFRGHDRVIYWDEK